MKLQLKRSLRLSNGAAQAPSAEQMSYGEIAVNYSDTDPSIFLKDSTNVVRKLAISSLPDTSSSSAQSGTLDDRYLMLSGGTVSGDVSATNFVGGVARVATSAPASASESELWFNSSTGRLYIRYSGQWVDASPDSFTMGTDFYSKTQTDSAISTAVTALENGQVATNTAAISGLTSDIAAEESARLAAEADKMDVAGGTFTGPVSFNEDVIVKGGASGSGEITLNCEMNSHGVKLKGPAHSANASYTLTLPPSAGNSGEVLTTDGSGGLTWEESTSSPSALPALPSEMVDTDLLLIERDGVQYQIPSSDLVPVTGAIHTPVEVLTPINGAGVGGDLSYTPMTNTISAVERTERSSQRTTGGGYNRALYWRALEYVNGTLLGGHGTSATDYHYNILLHDPSNNDINSWNSTNVYYGTFGDRHGFAYGLGKYVSVGYGDSSYHNHTIIVSHAPNTGWIGRGETGDVGTLNIQHWYGYNYGARYIDFNDVKFANNMFVAVAQTEDWNSTTQHHNNQYYDQMTIYTSNDGLNWQYRNGPRGQWQACAYGNGRWVVVGKSQSNYVSNTRMATSTDGVSWSSVSGAPFSGYGDIIFANGMFVAVAHYDGSENNNSPICYSTDGLNWTTANATPGRYDRITYGDGKFVAHNGGTGSYRNKIVVSEDGINWTSNPGLYEEDGSDLNVYGLTYGGGYFWAGGNGYLFKSADGRNWDPEKVSISLLNDDVLNSADSSVVDGAALSTVIPQYTQLAADSNAGVTGEIYEITSPTSLTLYNTVGEWTTGMKAVSQTPITSYAPSPAEVTFTSENAGTTAVSATGTTLLSRTWTLETRASDSDPWTVQVEYEDFSIASSQDGATEWTTNKPTLLPNTQYRVKVAYNALGARTQESPYHTFTTGDF